MKCLLFSFFTGVLGFFSVFPVFSQDVLTVEDAVRIGLENNYDIRISQNDVRIADNNVSLGNAGFLPELYLIANQNNTITNTRQVFVSGEELERTGAESRSFNAGAVFNWTIFDGLRMFTTYDRLRELQVLGETSARATIEGAVSLIITNYYNVVLQQQQLLVLQEKVAASQERVNIEGQNYEIGTASRLQLLQAQVDLNSDRSALIRQEEVLLNARVQLNELLARPVTTDFNISDTIPLLPVIDREVVYQQARQQNAELRLAQLNTRIADLQLKEHNAARWPQVDINLGYNYNSLSAESGFYTLNQNRGFNYGLSATMPIFNGFNQRREQQNLRIVQENAQLQLNAFQSRLDASIEQAFTLYANNLSLLEIEEENLEVAFDNLDITTERHRLGMITPLELREAQNNYALAQSRLISAIYNAKAAEVELLRLSGNISR